MGTEIEIELHDTTTLSGEVYRTSDKIGDPRAINGTIETYDYIVENLRVEFMGINVAHLLTDAQREKYKEDLIEKFKDKL